MSLVCLPSEIWYDILFRWFTDIRDIVRMCFATISNPLCAVYNGMQFSFPNKPPQSVFEGLCSWMRSRHVYINEVKITESNELISSMWSELFEWTGKHVQDMTYCGGVRLPAPSAFSIATKYIHNLQRLSLNANPTITMLQNLLENNASTLTSIRFGYTRPFCRLVGLIMFPRITSLHWEHLEAVTAPALVRKCPALLAVTVLDGYGGCNNLALTVAETASNLRMLSLTEQRMNSNVSDDTLRQIARGCPALEVLELYDCYDSSIGLADVVCLLPSLCILAVTRLLEPVLLEIAARGHPSLRIIDTRTPYTYAGLRQITAALSQLTGLSVSGVEPENESDAVGLLQYCHSLQRLNLAYCSSAEIVNAVLASAAVHCPDAIICLIGLTEHAASEIVVPQSLSGSVYFSEKYVKMMEVRPQWL